LKNDLVVEHIMGPHMFLALFLFYVVIEKLLATLGWPRYLTCRGRSLGSPFFLPVGEDHKMQSGVIKLKLGFVKMTNMYKISVKNDQKSLFSRFQSI